MLKRVLPGLVAAVGLLAGLAAADDASLPVSRMRDWQLVIAPGATAAERYAAEEFQRFFREATGIDLPYAADPHGPGRLYIGPGAAPHRSRLAFDTAGYVEEEFRIRVDRRGIAIAGGRPRGTLYGVYHFIESYLGVRFLTAGHTHVPRDPDLRLPLTDLRYAPPFVYRWSYCKEASAFPEFAARLRLNTLTPEERFGGVTRDSMESHTLFHQVPVSNYGESHPEYFAWVDAGRMLKAPGGGPQVCPSNPEVVDLVAQAVLDDLARRPGAANASVAVNDNPYYCRCPACEAVNDREGTPAAAHLALVNAVADRVARAYPGVKVATLAYNYTRKPPRRLRPRPNVQVWFCAFEACAVHRLDDPACPRNAPVLADLDAWLAVCPDLRVWLYNTNLRSLDLPYPNLRSLGPNLRLLRERGVRGAFMQANDKCPAGEFADLRNYVTSRLLWDPRLDAAALRDEFLRLHYGPAADAVRAAIDLVHDRAEASGAHPYCWSDPTAAGIDGDTAERLLAKLEQAAGLAPDDATRHRVEKLSLGAYKALLETRGRFAFDGNRVRLLYPANEPGLVPRYRDLCERYGMNYDSEFWSRDDFLERLRHMTEGAPALRLENAAWRLTLLRDNGELVDLFHKPSGRQWLRAWDCPGVSLAGGTWGDWIVDGAGPFTPFECRAGNGSAVLTRRLADGSRITRTLRLLPDAVEFSTEVRHEGATSRLYRVFAEGDLAADPLPAIVREGAQFAAPRVEPEPGLPGARVEMRAPAFRLEKGGVWRGRYRLQASAETTH